MGLLGGVMSTLMLRPRGAAVARLWRAGGSACATGCTPGRTPRGRARAA